MAWQRKIPFGYQVQEGKIQLQAQETEAVRAIFAQYLAGASYQTIAEGLSEHGPRYHEHTPLWNKHMVKRILGNGKYLGTELYPRLVSDEDFLAVQLQREDRTDYAPCPASLDPIRERAVCAVCGGRIVRDTKSHGRSRWVCARPDCGAVVHVGDEAILKGVSELLRRLAEVPDRLTPPLVPEAVPSADALRIRNELNLYFNRADIDPNYMKTLIFAAAAEQYAVLPDVTPIYDVEVLRERLEVLPVDEADLQELLTKAVKSVRIGGPDRIALELTNGTIIRKEQTT